MKKLTIALISGGISSEREVSLASGQKVYDALDKDKYEVLRFDPRTDIGVLVEKAPEIDAALIILHGPYGEDGTVQGLLELLGVPYQGSTVLGSAAAMNKLASKRLYEKAGLLVPPYMVVEKRGTVNHMDVKTQLGLPMVIKPISGGSSIGMSIIQKIEELEGALDKAFEQSDRVLVEKYINGTEITGGVLGNDALEAFPLIEIVPGEGHAFFDYEAKYQPGATNEICPARIDDDATAKAQQIAIEAHRALFCNGYSRTDMILDDNKDIFVLETNTIPGMTPTSLLPQGAQAAGYGFGQLLDRLIELGMQTHAKQQRKDDHSNPS